MDNSDGIAGVSNVEVSSLRQHQLVVYHGQINQRGGVNYGCSSPIEAIPIQEARYSSHTIVGDDVQSPEYSTPPEEAGNGSPEHSPAPPAKKRGRKRVQV